MAPFGSSPFLLLSPHPDDAVLSCGGLLLRAKAGLARGRVLTLFSGDAAIERPRPLARLASPTTRREEDRGTMAALGVELLEAGLPDAIDRLASGGRRLYRSPRDLFAPAKPQDTAILERVVSVIQSSLAEDELLISPLAVGGHVDHRLAARAALALGLSRERLYFYEDAPYVFGDSGEKLPHGSVDEAAAALKLKLELGGRVEVALDERRELAAGYPSQIRELFGSLERYGELAAGYYGARSDREGRGVEHYLHVV